MRTFTVTPIDRRTADVLRREIQWGRRPARVVTLDEPGAPCRSCLRRGAADERMWLFTYQPFRGDSFYAVPSPVFLHVQPCSPYDEANELPDLVRDGQRAVRSYDEQHNLVDGVVADGEDIGVVIDKLLADARAEYLHIYSATAGCFTCRVDRR